MDTALLTTYTDKYTQLRYHLNERQRRLVAAADADMLGWGGIELIHCASGLDHKTIRAGIKELKQENPLDPERCRRRGGGRKKLTELYPTLVDDLNLLVDNNTVGDPERPLKWTCKSTRTLAKELKAKKHSISNPTVGEILKEQGYRLQSNKKSREGIDHPDRDKQFKHINEHATKYLESGDPVISVDTKKKELVGNYRNEGKIWLPKGKPKEVNMHDFPDKKIGKAVPYGIYDVKNNAGYVNVGITHDTSEFAVESIRRWWHSLGKKAYPQSKRLLVTADSGGSNGYRLRLWKKELQKFAHETGLEITVNHFPPGTSKWNKIEHRLFSFISTNWKGVPLTSYQVIINLIANTKTETGLKVYAVLDDKKYEKGQKVTDAQMEALHIQADEFHGEWNYVILPQRK
jgi:hypothetical protein